MSQRVALFVGADAKYMYDFRAPLLQLAIQKGYRVVVLATPVNGFDHTAFSRLGTEFVPWTLRKAQLNPLGDVGALAGLWRLLRRERPSLVFAHTIKPVMYAMVLAKLAGTARRAAMIPGLGYAFSPPQDLKHRALAALARLGYRLALRSSDIVILQNGDDRRDLVRLGVLRPGAAAVVVPGSGVDLKRFAAAPMPSGPPTFLFVARLIRDKGIYEFAEAARRVRSEYPTARFIVVGAADENPGAVGDDDLARWKSEGLLELAGHVASPEVYFSQCHVFVLPSYYREGTPRTNLEAMASARPVITADTPGCRETVEHGVTGFLVPPRDAPALADAMLRLAGDPKLRRDMGTAGRKRCERVYELNAVSEITFSHISGMPAGAMPSDRQGPSLEELGPRVPQQAFR